MQTNREPSAYWLHAHLVEVADVARLLCVPCGRQGSDLFDPRLLKNVIKMVDVSYGGEAGFNQAIELSAETLGSVKLVQVCYALIPQCLSVLWFGIRQGAAWACGLGLAWAWADRFSFLCFQCLVLSCLVSRSSHRKEGLINQQTPWMCLNAVFVYFFII